MDNPDTVLDAARRLQQAGKPYALVSVIKALPPASARPGDKAVVTAEGDFYGWVGGGCAQPAVVRTVRRVLADGQARVIRIAPTADGHETDLGDVLEFGMACRSGGTLELFVDPELPRAQLIVIGSSPVAASLAQLAPRVGFSVTVVAHDGQAADYPDAAQVIERDDETSVLPQVRPDAWVIIATQGRRDLQALRLALALQARQVSFVASSRKANVLKESLIAGGADPVVVGRTPGHADVFGHRDLHMVDVVAVPQRLVHLVGEAERQEVLDGLLAEVVVDAEHVVGREDALDDRVALARGPEVGAERLLDDDPAPRVALLLGEAGQLQLLGHDREHLRRDGEVERVVAHGAAFGVELVDGLLELAERRRVVEGPLDEPDALCELAPHVLVERGAGVLLDGVVDELGEVLVLPVASGEPDQREPGRQEPPVREVVHRGHQLLAGQVARHAEDDEGARPCDAVQPTIGRKPERVVLRGDRHR